MTTPTQLIQELEGQTISEVEVFETSDSSIHSVVMTFTNGTRVSFSPTSFNYGPQNLVVDLG